MTGANSTDSDAIFVRSHVARDLLQNAGLFKTDRLVVWEYVSNGLQYVDPGTSPVVHVHLDNKKKQLRVIDNGRGMTWKDLQNFLIMHGENIDRARGLPGRGRFGTGKSAAFGIGKILRVSTVRNGSLCVVELHRSDIDAMGTEDPIPVRTIRREESTPEPNGTVIEVEEIQLRAIDQQGIIRYVERHLARWSKGVKVYVNYHECEFTEPPVASESQLRPNAEQWGILGDVVLTLKVAKVPLEEDLRGVAVFSKGVWHETTLAGSEGREMSQYIFGEIDVPLLDEDDSAISPFDVSRSMRLNINNERVRVLFAFIGFHVDGVRRELVKKEEERKASAEARRLRQQAREIEKVLNEDFDDFRNRVVSARATKPGSTDLLDPKKESGGSSLLFGGDIPADVVETGGDLGHGVGGEGGGGAVRPAQPRVEPGGSDAPGSARLGGAPANVPRRAGGFRVEFNNAGEASNRAQYVSAERCIYINLDHPQLAALRGKGWEDEQMMRRLAYEIAFSEYSIALASELASHDEYLDPTDPIVDIRESVNRLARKAAYLFLSSS